ncbi:MAG: hypothetical protein IAF38_18830, partial [Bacteroidia bacterium]|nr:hypothetical protein [Bacteroidia bacterium]
LNGFFCFDHLYQKPGEEFLKEWKTFISLPLFKETNYSPFCFDVSAYHNLGANSVTELAYFILQVNEYLNFAEQNKISLGNKEIVIMVSVGNNFFESVAKLRALRKLFSLLTKQYGLKNPLYLYCKNSLVNKSTLDIHNNLLRSTTEGMAAVIGGANSLSLFPFNDAVKENDPEGLRWARNQQIIFKEEAALNKVADMSAGSYYIETLTRQLAENAWKIFQAIESEGGFIACIKNGFIPELIAAMANKQKVDFAAGKKILVGVNKFSNEKEKVFSRLAEKISSINLILSAETESAVAAKKKEHA